MKFSLHSFFAKSKTKHHHTPRNEVVEYLLKNLDDHIDLSRKDIQDWRDALVMATDKREPSRAQLYDIYTKQAIDPFLVGQMEMRILSILNTPFFIYDESGHKDEKASKLINKQYFYTLLRELQQSIFYGYTLLEFGEVSQDHISFQKVPYRNMIPTQGIILENAYDRTSKAFPIKDLKHMLSFGDVNDLGILNNLIPHLIWKSHAEQSWSQFQEKFGLPMLIAKTSKNNKKDLEEINDRLSNVGQQMTASIPFGTELTIMQPNATDAYMVFLQRIEQCNKQMATMIVQSNTLSETSANRSQTEVHERNLKENIVKADSRKIAFWINDVFLPFVRSKGIAIPQTHTFAFDWTQTMPLEKQWEITKGLLHTHDIEDEWITKTFNIPVKKKPLTTPKPTIPNKQNIHYPLSIHHDQYPLAKAEYKRIDQLITEFANELWHSDKDNYSKLAQITNANKDIFDDALRTSWLKKLIKTQYDSPDLIAYQHMEINLFKFAMAKTIKQAQQINALLLDNKGKRRTWNNFKTEVDKLNIQYNSHYLKTEYNHAVAVGQSSRNWLQLQKDKDINPFVQYQTIGDDKVRSAHKALDGKVLDLNDPQVAIINPPNAWNCRCELVPYTQQPKDEQIITGNQAIRLLDKGLHKDFAYNYASAKKVFANNLMYLSMLNPDMKTLGQLTFKDYGLDEKPKSNIKLNLSNDSLEQAREKVLDNMDDNKRMAFKDYHGRSLSIKEKTYRDHTKGKTYIAEQRHLLFEKVKDIINKPDEVYLDLYFKGDIPQFYYIKHYADDNSIVVSGNLNNDQTINIKTWFKLTKDYETKRKGLKIK